MQIFRKFAHRASDTEDVAFRKMLIFVVASACSMCGVAWTALYLYVFGMGLTAALPFAFVIIVGSALLISHFTGNYLITVYAQMLCITWITALIQWSIGSIDQSGMVISWSFLGPLGALIFLSRKQAVLWMSMFLFIVIVSAVWEPTLLGQHLTVSDNIRTLFYIMNLGTSMSVVFGASAWFVSTIQKEKDRSDGLLLNILPSEVAEELKMNGSVAPRDFENTTVLFTDFKGFTDLADQLSAKELVEEINHCFTAFDNITSKYNVEKVKTIGDAYMAVGGGISAADCPPCNMIAVGLEMQSFMAHRQALRKAEGKRFFEMRVGIHTGHVVAGVVGVKKFQYDIWGDTVNIAARMESHSEVGCVNISAATYHLVKERPELSFTYREKVHVKGKGEMDMYFVSPSA